MPQLLPFRNWLPVFTLVLLIPAPLPAQEQWPVSVEAYLGATHGYSDDDDSFRGNRAGIFADLLLGMRVHGTDRSGVFIALDFTGHGVNISVTDDCVVAPDGGCVPWFPGMAGISTLAGWESRSTDLRILVGPGIVSSDSEPTPGLTSRIDGALPLFWHLSGVATLSSLFVPTWNGDRFFYVALGAGLRFR